jgi:hypothetical protein
MTVGYGDIHAVNTSE